MKVFFLGLVVLFSVFSSAVSIADSADESIVMERSDGSKQCEPKPKAARVIKGAKRELSKQGIRVQEIKMGHDGKMYAQMCGAPTGVVVQIRIQSSDRAKAESLGFSVTSSPAP